MGTKTKAERTYIQRSFTLPRHLAEEAMRIVPRSLARNLNQLVTLAMSEMVEKFRQAEFERKMAQMGSDPAIQRESSAINEEFRATDSDGL